MLIILTPRSEKAQNSLANCLHGDPVVILEAMGADEILVASADRAFSTWIALKGDPDWGYAFTSFRPSPDPGFKKS
jgi:hypothetical protein